MTILQPMRQRQRSALIARSFSLPAPTGGLNSIDSLADMPASDAIVMENFFPQQDYVELRRGHASHATGISAAVLTLAEWAGPASSKFFAATANAVFEVTASGAVGGSEFSGQTNGKWQHVMQATSGGNFLIMCNGADAVRAYDGSTWTTPTFNGAATTANFINIALHKERLWFVEKETTDAWFLGTSEVTGGTELIFPLGPQFKRGGKLQAIGSMSLDGGAGQDDFICFISSEGEVAIYSGTDPAGGGNFALVGVYLIPAPIGNRCVEKAGGDLAIITRGGLVSLTQLLTLDRSQAQLGAVTGKINPAFTLDARAFTPNFGWQMLSYARSNMLIVNVPEVEGTLQNQYVMNTLSGSWGHLTGLNANCWGVFGNELYFGDNVGTVFKADSGTQDNGAAITGDLKTAFTHTPSRGRLKQYTMMRTLFETNGTPGFLMGLNVNYEDTIPTSTPTASPIASGVWNVGDWNDAVWGGNNTITQAWQGATGLGSVAAVRLRVVSDGAFVKVHGFDVMAQLGGII